MCINRLGWILLGIFGQRLFSNWDVHEAEHSPSDSYNKAKQIKEQQDAFCEKALNGEWAGVDKFPEELQWEAVVDVLRGKVKV